MTRAFPSSSHVRLQLNLADEEATVALGEALARALREELAAIERQGIAIALEGALGAGKTSLARALLRSSGVSGAIKSPTFNLLEPYEVSRLHFYHFDFYRFKSPKEFEDGGFSEYFGPAGVCLVEWPERAGRYLPPVDLRIALHMSESNDGVGRAVAIDAHTEVGARCLDHLENLQTAALRETSAGA